MAGEITINIDQQAINAVVCKLNKLAEIEKAMETPMRDALDLVFQAIAPYPPAPPQSSYVRTNTLLGRWHKQSRAIPDGFEGRVYNNTDYAMWVQGGDTQTAVHRRTGWKTDKAVAADKGKEVQVILERAIERIVEGG